MILPEGSLSKQSLLLSELDYDTVDGSPKSRPHVPSPLVSSHLAPESPPGYLETRRPNTQITYTFFPQTIPASSMVMKPPSYVKNPHPSYYISVNMNCFTPSSYITTIRRDGWEGEVVGDFEMGISALRKASTVCFRGYERPLNEMLQSSSKIFRGASYLWKPHSEVSPLELYWEEESPFAGASTLSCFFGTEKMTTNLVAKFMPAGILARRPERNKSDLTRLQVFPQGHDFLDDIVISVLIIERMRTSPSMLKDIPSSMLKDLF